MIASICTGLFSLTGAFVIEIGDKSIIDDVKRRVSRTATLDGGATTVDLGYSDSDRSFTLITKNVLAATEIREKARTHSNFTLSVKSGFFRCTLEKITFSSGEAKISLLAV